MSGQIDQRHLLNKCLVIDLRRSPGSGLGRPDDPASSAGADEDGFAVFKAWLSVNLECYWSPALLSALRRLTLVGLLRPCLLLVTAAPGHLEVIRSAWCQRTLRAPPGYAVAMLGEAHGYNVTPVAPGQFTSLPEAICYVIQTLNSGRPEGKVTLDDVCCHLRLHFPHLELPDRAVVFSTLGRLVRERKIYHTRQGYQIVTPETYQQQLAAEMERDAVRAGRLVYRVVQTDLADIILGGSDSDRVIHARPQPGDSLAPPAGLASFARRHSLKLSANQREEYFRRASSMRYPSGTCLRPPAGRRTFTDETPTSDEYSVLERPSLLSKLLRLAVPRRQLATFSAQFPPPEWTSGDVTHLHSVGTQTNPHRTTQRGSADRSPKVLRSRRHKKQRPVNGSMDHLAESTKTSVLTSAPQMAPRSSTLPRRTKLSEFLAETASDEQKLSAKSGRQRHRSPRKKSERLRSPADILRVVGPGDRELIVDPSASRDGVSPELAGGSPSHAETLAQRHVRERLEARARHSSSRTSSGSSLERSDNSPATSLERGMKLELPRQARDGRDGKWEAKEATERRSRSATAARVKHDAEADQGVGSPVGRSGPSRESPTQSRSPRTTGGSPSDSSRHDSSRHDSGRPPSTEESRASCPGPDESPSRRKAHKSPRRSNKESRLKVVESERKVVDDSHASSRHESNREIDSQAEKMTPKHRPHDSNRDFKEHVVKSSRDSKHRPVDSNREKSRSTDSSREKSRSTDSTDVVKHRQNGTNGDIRRNHGYVNQDSKIHSSVGRRAVEENPKRDPSQPVANLSHVENKEYFDVYQLEVMDEKGLLDRPKRGENEPVYQNIGVLAVEEPPTASIVNGTTPTVKPRGNGKAPKVSHERSAISPKTRENGDVPSPRRQEHRDRSSPRHHRDHVTPVPKTRQVRADVIPTSEVTQPSGDVTLADVSGELRSSHRRKDQNTNCVLHARERKQMNNEKVLEATSPTRPERLSVKNIFHELSAPAKVPPKSLPDGINPDPRLTRPLTYHDLVKTPPAKMADVTLPASKMADAPPAPNKMADTTATQPTETPSESIEKRPTSPGDESLRTYPSLSSLNLNFKSLAAQRLLHGASANSIDTLVEVNMAADRRRSAGSTETTLLGIL